ncbi:YacP-like NYN domain-containing protein [Mycobacterium sp. BK558]|nr:YacP-like NYN domain-containing protein [Mycobacterium sp. BK558]
MNVIGTRPDGWWRDRHRAMTDLVHRLERWSLAEQVDVTVVFEQPPVPPIESDVVTIAHAPAAGPNSADDEIVWLIGTQARPDDVVVATSDRTLAGRVRSGGAAVVPAERLRNLIDPH